MVNEMQMDREVAATFPDFERKTERLLRLPEVLYRTGLSRSTIYQLIGRQDFPSSVQLGPRAVAWRESDVTSWIESRTNRGSADVTR